MTDTWGSSVILDAFPKREPRRPTGAGSLKDDWRAGLFCILPMTPGYAAYCNYKRFLP